MISRIRDAFSSQKLTPEHQLETYAELLLVDANGNDRTAVSERIIATGAAVGGVVARATFFKEQDGYFVVEYHNHSPDPVCTTYMMPVEQMDNQERIPADAKWATGTIRHKKERFSEYTYDDIERIVKVVSKFFSD